DPAGHNLPWDDLDRQVATCGHGKVIHCFQAAGEDEVVTHCEQAGPPFRQREEREPPVRARARLEVAERRSVPRIEESWLHRAQGRLRIELDQGVRDRAPLSDELPADGHPEGNLDDLTTRSCSHIGLERGYLR